MTEHELVIRLGRPRDVQFRGKRTGAETAFSSDVTEITIPFGDRDSAVAAHAELVILVRQVHDAGGEDYHPVASGQVLTEDAVLTSAGDEYVRDLMAKMRAAILAPKPNTGDVGGDLVRDMQELAELEGTVRAWSNPGGFCDVETRFVSEGVLRVSCYYSAIKVGDAPQPETVGWACYRREATLNGEMIYDPRRAQALADEAGIVTSMNLIGIREEG